MLKTFIIGELLMYVLAGNIHKEAKHFHDKSVQIDSRKYLENIYNYYLKGELQVSFRKDIEEVEEKLYISNNLKIIISVSYQLLMM